MVSASKNAQFNTLEDAIYRRPGLGLFNEMPSIANVAGGTIVMAAVVGHVPLS